MILSCGVRRSVAAYTSQYYESEKNDSSNLLRESIKLRFSSNLVDIDNLRLWMHRVRSIRSFSLRPEFDQNF